MSHTPNIDEPRVAEGPEAGGLYIEAGAVRS